MVMMVRKKRPAASSGITMRGGAAGADGGTSGNRNLTLPSGTVAGDKALLVYFNTPPTATWVTPSGWTQEARANLASAGELVVASLDGTISSTDITNGYLTVNLAASFNDLAFGLITFTGQNATLMDATPVAQSNTSDFTSPSTINIPGITTVTNNAIDIAITCSKSTTPAWANKPAGFTDLIAQSNGTTAANIYAAYKLVATAGAQSGVSVQSAGTQYELAVRLALRPA